MESLVFGKFDPSIEYKERVGAYAVIINDKWEVCTVKTPNGYFLPGGGKENSEDYEQCLKRECIEEIGYKVKIRSFIGEAANYTWSQIINENIKVVGEFYLCTLDERTAEPIEKDHQMEWLNVGEGIRQLHLKNQSWAVREAMKLLKKKESKSNYLDAEGKIKVWPSKNGEKVKILEYLSTKFEHNHQYTEKEVNEIINQWHTFNDYFLLRRGMVDYGFIKRTRSGDKYWRE